LEFQIGLGRLPETLRDLGRHLTDFDQGASLSTFAELCALVEQTPGIRFGELVARLPKRAPDGEAAVAQVLRLARDLPTHEVLDLRRHFAWWDPVLAGIVTAAGGNPQAGQAVEQALTDRREQADWAKLAGVLRRLLAGDRSQQLLEGLDPIDTAIVQRALDALAGQVQLDPDSWQALTGPALPEEFVQLVTAVAAAANGDQGVAAELEPILIKFASEQEWATLAGVLRRILAGDRDQALLRGLDETDSAVVTAILNELDQPGADQP
jgi:hypothetical protein